MSSQPTNSLDPRRTLCLVSRPNQILLGRKKRGFGEGLWNGFGGKINWGESIEAAAIRELQEESGIQAQSLEQRGKLFFTFADKPLTLEVHVFSVSSFLGEPIETEEMQPQWFDLDTIPYHQMWADDQHWLPLFLAGNQFEGSFHFHNNETLLHHDVKIIEAIKLA